MGEVVTKRFFENPVDSFDLLLLPKLDAIFRKLFPALTVLTWSVSTLLNGTFGGFAPISFQKQLHTFAPTQATNRTSISRQLIKLPN
jgi:hypothetical protein